MAKSDLTTASVLAFERKLDPSDAIFSAGNWNDKENAKRWSSVKISTKSVRGTISNRLKAKDQDPTKLDASIQKPNLQTVDMAALPPTNDTLQTQFTLRILGGAGTPSACNNSDYQNKLLTTIQQYKNELGFSALASRYAYNLANGRFLWRNRMSAEQVEIQINHLQQGETVKSWTFDALSLSLRDFEQTSSQLEELSHVIQQGLNGDNFVLLEINAFARMGNGQEVYPSQELILDKGDKKGQKSKTLYDVDEIAAMHSQKIGNALRTIDTWYDNPEGEELGPIAVEPYGSVTSLGRAYRQPKAKMDFYNLLDKWVLKDQQPEPEQQHYVIANLIRGGVFGDSEKA